MSFTLLHVAGALPLRKDVDMKGFAAINILIDVEVLLAILLDMPQLHTLAHTLTGALFLSVVLWWATCWSFGSILFGALSHIFIDALYHSDVTLGVFKISGIVPPVAIDLFLLALPVVFWRQWVPAAIAWRPTLPAINKWLVVRTTVAVLFLAVVGGYSLAYHSFCDDYPTTCANS